MSIFPSTPEVNDTFTSNGTTWKWDGSSWNFFSSPAFIGVGGDATVAFQIDQPDVSELEAGALWIDSDEDISNGLLTATFTRWVSLLSASTLVLEGLDEKDLSLLYTPGFEKVYINGILLVRDEDYTAEDGTTIELNVAAEEGDVAEVDVFESFAIANTYTKTQADNKFLTQNSASAEYLSQDSASAEYLTQTSANETYLEQVNAQAPFRNLIINGAMQVAQRATSVTGQTSGGYKTVDRWNQGITSQGTWTITQEADAPAGFAYSHKMLCTTADAAPAASDNIQFFTTFEGQNLQKIKKGTASAQQLTLSFWVKSNVTGTYIAELYDGDNNRQTSKSYTVNSSATWEYKTITFAADTTGAFDKDNGLSLYCIFALGAGSDFTSGTLQTTWAAAVNANRFVGQTNLAAATNNYWQVTGVQLEVGAVATPFEFKPFAQDLQECQRYYYLIAQGNNKPIGIGVYFNSSEMFTVLDSPIQMRIAPTISVVTGTDFYAIDRNSAADGFNNFIVWTTSENIIGIYNASQISGTAGQAGMVRTNNASAFLAVQAEL